MRSRITSARARTAAAVAVAALAAQACESRMVALGDYTSIVVTASPDVWAELEEPLVEALERTVFTVRDEKTFTVTYQDPSDEAWSKLRLLKQQLLIGRPGDFWVDAALEKAGAPDSAPGVAGTANVWARRQNVRVLVLDEAGPSSALELLPSLADDYDESFRQMVHERMFVSGVNQRLANTLREEAGFSLLLPDVYEHTVRDSVYVFRNDNPDPSELIRQIAVAWRSPVPPSEDMQADDLLDWRARIVDEHYNYPQVTKMTRAKADVHVGEGSHPYYRIQAVWENPPEAPFPAAGPFILHAVVCFPQDRLYLVDAWLYAPGKEKYEYMIQLEKILDSFSCTEAQ